MLNVFYDNVKFMYLSRRKNIKQDNFIIRDNEKKYPIEFCHIVL